MDITAQLTPLFKVETDWLIVGVWEEESLAGTVAELDSRLDGALTRLIKAGDITGKAKEITTLLDKKGIAAQRLLVLGLGTRDKSDRADLIAAVAAASRSITGKATKRIALALPENVPGLGWEEVAVLTGVGLMQGCDGPGLRKNKPDRFQPEEICVVAPSTAPADEVKRGANRAAIEGRAVSLARELVNTPPCDLYPETFAAKAQEAARAVGVDCTVLDENQLEKERMGSLLGVARGSERPPRLVVLHYRGKQGGKTLGLVGKGVTFDSGGLSLKTSDQMVDMKCDMAGAAAVLAAFTAVAELKVPVNLLGLLPLVENLPSGHSMKLGDVLHAR